MIVKVLFSPKKLVFTWKIWQNRRKEGEKDVRVDYDPDVYTLRDSTLAREMAMVDCWL